MPSSAGAGAGALAAALVALSLAGCQKADPDVRPFSIRMVDVDGAPVLPTTQLAPLVALEGPAEVVGPGELRLDDRVRGVVTITFDAAAHPEVAFPARLTAPSVRVAAQYNDGLTAPDGTPLPYAALRAGLFSQAFGTEYRFLLVDSPYTDSRDLGDKPRPIGPEPTLGDNPQIFPDFPDYTIEASHARFEPGDCGLVYHDLLVVLGDDERSRLRSGERATTVLGVGTDPWTTLHMDSWHRAGSCPDDAKTWTQWAAWR